MIVASLVGAALIALQIPLAALLLGAMGGSEGVTRAAKTYFIIRIWSSPLALANYVVLGWLIGQARATLALTTQVAINVTNMVATVLLVLVFDLGIAGAAIAAVIAEAAGLLLGILIAQRLCRGQPATSRATLFERAKLMRLLSVNRDILIRTAALIAAFLFFTAQGARAGDVTLAANSVLNNFLMIAAFFLDGLANAAQQLCGQAYGARDKNAFAGAVKLVVIWGFGFALAVAACFLVFGPAFIDIMTASAEVRRIARDYLPFVIFAPLLGVFAFGFDGIYIGATWARDMRNLMLASLAIFLAAWFALRSFGNAGLWGAFLVHYAARGGLQALEVSGAVEEVVRTVARMERSAIRGRRRGEISRISLRSIRATAPRTRLLHRPVLGGDRRRIRADDLRQRVAPGAQQGRRQIALDVLDQAKPLVNQRRVELDQAGAGADLRQRRAAGIDAADADQWKRALGADIGLGHHARRQSEQRPSG